jgi:hypothetical protein
MAPLLHGAELRSLTAMQALEARLCSYDATRCSER